MSSELDKKVSVLKEEFYNTDEVKEYLQIKKQIEENTYLNSLKKELFKLQKDISLSMADESKHSSLVNEYKNKLQEYNSHPLIMMYNNSYEVVESLILNIKDILEK